MMLTVRVLAVLWLLLACLGEPAAGQEPPEEAAGERPPPSPREEVALEDVVVVTASRTEQRLQELPTAMTVLTEEMIQAIPSDDYGDLLRNVPGVNVSQMNARDLAITGREATFNLANKQLALVDGRSLYLDFLGFIMWDFLPLNPREIKQIEVVRGPGSAVWGANAMTGVVNVITKTPAEMSGTSVMLGAGELSTLYGSLTHAGATEKLGYKVSGTYYGQDGYERPSGEVPGTGTPYPDFPNRGTSQPKGDLRLDYQPADDTRWSFSGGYAGTDGILHSGVGPFDIFSGSSLTYLKGEWNRRALRVGVYANLLDGDAENLLTVGVGGNPLNLGFNSQTYNLDMTETRVVARDHVLTYGANARRSNYDLSIAPRGENRDELGVFLQDEMLLGDKVRWLVGARFDDIDPIGGVVSPRTSLLFSPSPGHTLRASYNRAFRAPSLVENYLEIVLENVLPLPAIPELGIPEPIDYLFPTFAVGDPGLREERLDAYEVGYVGALAEGIELSVSLYRSELTDAVDFFGALYYSSENPPPGWPLPDFVLDLPQLEGQLPAVFTYRNVGRLVNKGVELGLDGRISGTWSWFANYSYQDRPEVEGVSATDVNIAPKNRFNLGAFYNRRRFFVSANINHSDDAYWADVLDSRFYGWTQGFTQVNSTIGTRFSDERYVVSLIGQNIFDERVQQHVFGDIISRKIVVQLAIDF